MSQTWKIRFSASNPVVIETSLQSYQVIKDSQSLVNEPRKDFGAVLYFPELLSIKGPVAKQNQWKLGVLEIAGDIPALGLDFLPKDWKNRPYPRASQEFGTAWAKG